MPAVGGAFGCPRAATLYSNAHARPSSAMAQGSRGIPPPSENINLVEGAQLVRAAVGGSRRLADVAIRFERRDHRFDVAGGERPVVLADHVGHLQGRIWLKQRRAGPLHT